VKNDANVNGLIFSATDAQKLDGGRSSRRIIRVKMRRAGALLARTFPSDYSGTDDSFHGPLLEFSPLPQTAFMRKQIRLIKNAQFKRFLKTCLRF